MTLIPGGRLTQTHYSSIQPGALDDGQGLQLLLGQSARKSFSHNSCGINPNLTKRLGRVNINDIYRKIGPILEDFALLQFS